MKATIRVNIVMDVQDHASKTLQDYSTNTPEDNKKGVTDVGMSKEFARRLTLSEPYGVQVAGTREVADLDDAKRLMASVEGYARSAFESLTIDKLSGNHKPDLALAKGGDHLGSPVKEQEARDRAAQEARAAVVDENVAKAEGKKKGEEKPAGATVVTPVTGTPLMPPPTSSVKKNGHIPFNPPKKSAPSRNKNGK